MSKVDLQSCAENCALKTAYGAVAGGVSGFLISARPALRIGFTSFGAGIGLGIAFMQCRQFFDHPFSGVNNPDQILSKLPENLGDLFSPSAGSLSDRLGRFQSRLRGGRQQPAEQSEQEVAEQVLPALDVEPSESRQ